MSTRTPASVLFAVFGSALFVSTANGFPLTLSLDSSTSSLTLSGDASGISLEEQGSGSLVTSYFGSVSVEVDNPTAPTSIQFLNAAAAANILKRPVRAKWVYFLTPGIAHQVP